MLDTTVLSKCHSTLQVVSKFTGDTINIKDASVLICGNNFKWLCTVVAALCSRIERTS